LIYLQADIDLDSLLLKVGMSKLIRLSGLRLLDTEGDGIIFMCTGKIWGTIGEYIVSSLCIEAHHSIL
jgi:hypothetical protein